MFLLFFIAALCGIFLWFAYRVLILPLQVIRYAIFGDKNKRRKKENVYPAKNCPPAKKQGYKKRR